MLCPRALALLALFSGSQPPASSGVQQVSVVSLPTEAFPKYALFVCLFFVALTGSDIILLICSLVVVFLFPLECSYHEGGGVQSRA